jgi:nitrite reductase (NO-forming)
MNNCIKKTVLFACSLIISLLLIQKLLYSQEGDNPEYFDELSAKWKNSLNGQELLKSMLNQSVFQLSRSPVIPASFNFSTSTIQQNNPDTNGFIEIISRDSKLPIPQSSFVAQNVTPDIKFSIELKEGEAYIGKGVMFKGFVTNGTIPGPTMIANEGDIIEFTVVNKGTVSHGASIHAASTQTSKYLGHIPAGETRTMLFRVTRPGVYMYHCAPGGHAIPMHIIFGQYGMIVVKPKTKYKLEQILNKKPDVELYLLQHEIYSNGKDAIEGNALYTMWNGKIFRYVEDPIKAKPGDYVRIYFLNAGPNHVCTFHIVGILWDYIYWQGNPDLPVPGGQTVTAGPSDSWVIEFRVPPDEGTYTMLDHAVGDADRGAIGLLMCTKDAQTPVTILADGPKYSDQEMADIKTKIIRRVSPFEPGTPDVDPPRIYGPDTKEVSVKIIGNSFYPKVIQVTEGTIVTWQNEDIFTYMEGEFAGIHSVATYEAAPESFASPLLGHAETFKHTFEKQGEYKYMCAPHPYMKAVVTVVKSSGSSSSTTWIMLLSIAALILLFITLFLLYSIKKGFKSTEPA